MTSDAYQAPLYINFDLEMDGKSVCDNSIRSIGMAAYATNGQLIDTFYRNISPREDAKEDPACIRNFWNKYPYQWEKIQENAVSPSVAMKELSDWLRPLSKQYSLKFIAMPACIDWGFLKYYYDRFGPQDKVDLGIFCHCLSTLILAYRLVNGIQDKYKFMNQLKNGCHMEYNHHSLSDSIVQGHMYMNLRKLYEQQRQESFSKQSMNRV